MWENINIGRVIVMCGVAVIFFLIGKWQQRRKYITVATGKINDANSFLRTAVIEGVGGEVNKEVVHLLLQADEQLRLGFPMLAYSFALQAISMLTSALRDINKSPQ